MNDQNNGRSPTEIKDGLVRCKDGRRCKQGDDQCPYHIECFMGYPAKKLITDTLAYIEQLEAERDAVLAKEPKWISVEKQPEPPQDGEYWCYGYWIGSGRKQVETAEYLCGEWKIVNNFVLTHWMPLPEPPKEDV